MIYAGIDPGLKGGISIISSSNVHNKVSQSWKMPETDKDLFSILHYLKTMKARVVIEKAQCMPKMSTTAMFNYGVGYGKILGMLIALEIPYHEVRPTEWKKEVLAGVKDKRSKLESILMVNRIFPEADLLATPRSTVPHDGIAEAILIAEYGRRRNL